MAVGTLYQLFIFTLLAVCTLSVNVTDTNLRLEETARKHKTDQYELKEFDLIVRRGSSFDVSFTLTNVTQDSLSKLSLQLMYSWTQPELLPIVSRKESNDKENQWISDTTHLNFVNSSANVTFRVSVPLKAAVGAYSLQVKEDSEIIWDSLYINNVTLYVLFNPYHPSEPVFMSDKMQLGEYLESDVGAVYTGGALYRGGGDYWVFGQHQAVVMKGLMKLLDFHNNPNAQITINYTERTDPIIFSRKVADIMHNVDSDYGLMQGNWNGDYYGGVAPNVWTSSVPIYEQYLGTGRTVKYAQCWVFAAVATTALRAIGIPSRPITTYDAAHNSQDDLMVHECNDTRLSSSDSHFCNGDSIWNFHSWTEAWMTRSDLCDESGHCPTFSGWQVVDATPQEESIHDGTYAVGPSSKTALLSGNVVTNYDSSFVFAEVAAPVITWGVYNRTIMAPIRVDFNRVGSKIVTKKLNSNTTDFEDITSTYKSMDPEWHRVTLIKAFYEKGVNAELLGHKLTEEPVVDIKVTFKDHIVIGEPIEFNVTLRNNDAQNNQSVRYSLRLDSVYYTGIISRNVVEEEFRASLQPNETFSHTFVVPFETYYLKLVDMMHMNLVTKLHAAESDYSHFKEEDFKIHTPEVMVKTVTQPMANEKLTLTVSMTNTLPFRLTQCFLTIGGMRDYARVKLPPIKVNENMLTKITVTYDSSPVIFSTLDCLQLENIRGSLRIR